MDKISVIVPIYKVEDYLHRCLDSLLSQTYGELEIILVDDGSPDSCGAICDEYAARDSRIRVIHKENGGLSDARNAGLDAATGDYIGFVDSDDWLEPDMYEMLYNALKRTDSDMAACDFYYADPRKTRWDYGGVLEEFVLDRDDALRMLLGDWELQNYVWNKLYAARLWRELRFPVGKAFEDINTTWKAIDDADRVVLIPYIGYNYLVRGGGIVQSKALKNEIDCVEQGLDRYDALVGRFPECALVMEGSIMHTITKVWGLAWENRELIRKTYEPEMERFAAFSKAHLADYLPTSKLGLTGRLTLRLLPYARSWAYWASHMLHRLYLLAHPRPKAAPEKTVADGEKI